VTDKSGSSTKPKRSRAELASNRRASEEREKAYLRVALIKATAWRALVYMVGLALCIAATWLPASQLGGRSTVIDVQIAIAVTVTLAGAGALAAAWGNHHRRRSNRVEKRNKKLEGKIAVLQQRLRDHGLPVDVPD
jgi:membrane protein implicated in regulation of membrane protease activity